MSKKITSALSRVAAIALAAGLVAVPQANAETKTNLGQPLACNLQLKDPGAIPLGQASAVEGVYNSANSSYSNFRVSLAKTEAPDTVKQGEEFDYVIDAGTLGIPSQIKAAVTANVSRVSQLNMWYQLPANAELVSFKQEGGNADVKVEQVGNKLRFWAPAGTKGSQDVTKWSKSTRNQYGHGGVEATKAGSTFNIAMPKVTLRLKATGPVGSKIQPSVPKSDANKFGSDLPIQFYADASAKFLLSTITANGFIRCGLSEDDTYWPSQGSRNRNLPAEKFSAVTIEAAPVDAETYDPKAAGPVTITQGDPLPEAKGQIADFDSLPAGTKAEWATTHDTVGDNQRGKITVTYPDKSTDTVDVTVNVKKKDTQADLNDPKAAGPVTITQGDALPEAKDQITDFASLPAGTKAEWATTHDTVGDSQRGQITITYPDTSTDTVEVQVNVKEAWGPQARTNPTVVKQGDAIDDASAKAQITNADRAPEGTTFEWATKPDTSEAGEVTGTITVTVPGKAPQTVTVKYTVQAADAPEVYNPEVTEEVQQVNVGDEVTTDPKTLITNADQAPEGTAFTWKTKPDTSKPGDTTGVIEIAAPGETPVERSVRFNVVSVYTPQAKEASEVQIGTDINTVADAESRIANAADAPFGTTFEWAPAPDTTKVGQSKGTVKVTVPGKEPVEVEVTVNVVSSFVPQSKSAPTEVELGAEITDDDAKAQIANASDAPEGTTFTWVKKPSTDTAGEVTGTVAVQVPGQETKNVDVTYTVKPRAVDPNPEPNPEQSKLQIIGGNGPAFAPGSILSLKDKNGQTVNIKADENGAFKLRDSDELAAEQTITITGADGKPVTYKLNLDNHTFEKVGAPFTVGNAVAVGVLGILAMIGGLLQVPGAKALRDSGIAPQVADATIPVVSGLLALTGLGILISAFVPKTAADSPTFEVGDTEFTASGGKGSSS